MNRAVYLDLDGTLVTFDRPYGRLLTDALDSAGVPDPDAVAEAYGDRFFDHFEAFAENPYRRALTDAFEACGADEDPDRVADELIAAELDATTLRAGAREAIDRLGAGNAVGVLTNGVPAVQRGKLDRLDLADAVDEVVVSYEVGAHKPDPAIFEAARRRLDADEYVYVGDDFEHDVEPARDAGWLGVHLENGTSGIVSVPGFDDLLSLGRLFAE